MNSSRSRSGREIIPRPLPCQAGNPIESAIRLFHRRWSVPVVAVLHRDGPQRFGALVTRLTGASRDTLTETLRDLAANGIVTREAGLYALSTTGGGLGAPCLEATMVIPAHGLLAIALKKWPLLILVAIARGHDRFSTIKVALPGITSGALAPALKDLEAANLVLRQADGAYPPSVRYAVTPAATGILDVVAAVVDAAEAVGTDHRPPPVSLRARTRPLRPRASPNAPSLLR